MLVTSAFCWFFIHLSLRRIPLIKGKTARQTLQEKGLWDKYRKMYPYNPMAKFQAGSESMTNDADVSPEQRWFRLNSSYCLTCVALALRTLYRDLYASECTKSRYTKLRRRKNVVTSSAAPATLKNTKRLIFYALNQAVNLSLVNLSSCVPLVVLLWSDLHR